MQVSGSNLKYLHFCGFIGQEKWSNACRHADSMVEKAMKNDHVLEISLDKLIIWLTNQVIPLHQTQTATDFL